jgi:hypothetical protein
MDTRKVEHTVIKIMIVYDCVVATFYGLTQCFGYVKCQGFTPIAGDILTDSCLYGKAAHIIIGWNIGTSGIGVVGGSGAAATV